MTSEAIRVSVLYNLTKNEFKTDLSVWLISRSMELYPHLYNMIGLSDLIKLAETPVQGLSTLDILHEGYWYEALDDFVRQCVAVEYLPEGTELYHLWDGGYDNWGIHAF